jgi:hypothetical protein
VKSSVFYDVTLYSPGKNQPEFPRNIYSPSSGQEKRARGLLCLPPTSC